MVSEDAYLTYCQHVKPNQVSLINLYLHNFQINYVLNSVAHSLENRADLAFVLYVISFTTIQQDDNRNRNEFDNNSVKPDRPSVVDILRSVVSFEEMVCCP